MLHLQLHAEQIADTRGHGHQLRAGRRVQAGQPQQHVDCAERGVAVGVQPLAWVSALVGWARRGERRHAWACLAGAAYLIVIMVGA